jgi:hypothetical protein
MTDMPETITLAPLHDSTYVEYSTIGRFVNGAVYRRADLPPTPAQIASDPRVRGLVEALDELRAYASYAEIVGGIVVNRPQVREWCDRAAAALAAFRAEGGE